MASSGGDEEWCGGTRGCDTFFGWDMSSHHDICRQYIVFLIASISALEISRLTSGRVAPTISTCSACNSYACSFPCGDGCHKPDRVTAVPGQRLHGKPNQYHGLAGRSFSLTGWLGLDRGGPGVTGSTTRRLSRQKIDASDSEWFVCDPSQRQGVEWHGAPAGKGLGCWRR